MTDPSNEVRAMEAKERRHWITVAEGQNLRRQWDDVKRTIDIVSEKFDENPENETEAIMFITLAGLSTDSFVAQALAAAKKIKELHDDAAT